MDPANFLKGQREAIVADAEASLAGRHVRHYESAGSAEVRQRLETLFERLLDAVASRDLGPIISYAREIAAERFDAGYDLSEVQIAFNALEESVWQRTFKELDPSDFAETIGLVSTVLGAAKDALGRAYVSLATNGHAPSLDLSALFSGSEGNPPPG